MVENNKFIKILIGIANRILHIFIVFIKWYTILSNIYF